MDTSTNRSRRYCSERCLSRANVTAFQARQRGPSAGTETEQSAGG
ncbi:MAG: CGNR zinc finger domain-containing protein [Streptosporangiaceae bacterium]